MLGEDRRVRPVQVGGRSCAVNGGHVLSKLSPFAGRPGATRNYQSPEQGGEEGEASANYSVTY